MTTTESKSVITLGKTASAAEIMRFQTSYERVVAPVAPVLKLEATGE